MSLFSDYQQEIRSSFLDLYERNADKREGALKRFAYFYDQIRQFLQFVVEPGQRVLCLRSDIGQYLEWTRPARGLGVEFCPALVEIAKRRCPDYEFRVGWPEEFRAAESFDTILLVNCINDVFDVQQTLENLHAMCRPHTRLVLLWFNYLWKPVIEAGERLNIKTSQPPKNWFSIPDIVNLLTISGFEPIRKYRNVLLPFRVPLLSEWINRGVARLPVVSNLCLMCGLVARPAPPSALPREAPSVSIIVPCRDERENVAGAVERIPDMGGRMEILFCDDHSTDGTADEVRRMQAAHPEKTIRLIEGPGICKAENVWTGFEAAENDILMILDGDLAVPPEELPKFYKALVEGRGEFVNGTRAVYPMRNQAMRLANVYGNKAFSLLFSDILRETITDTLCGTKVLWRKDYLRLKPFRGLWGIRDRWGDYELIFGAARLNLKRVDVPVHYMERTYGQTKMTNRLRNALVMLRMCWQAYWHLR